MFESSAIPLGRVHTTHPPTQPQPPTHPATQPLSHPPQKKEHEPEKQKVNDHGFGSWAPFFAAPKPHRLPSKHHPLASPGAGSCATPRAASQASANQCFNEIYAADTRQRETHLEHMGICKTARGRLTSSKGEM